MTKTCAVCGSGIEGRYNVHNRCNSPCHISCFSSINSSYRNCKGCFPRPSGSSTNAPALGYSTRIGNLEAGFANLRNQPQAQHNVNVVVAGNNNQGNKHNRLFQAPARQPRSSIAGATSSRTYTSSSGMGTGSSRIGTSYSPSGSRYAPIVTRSRSSASFSQNHSGTTTQIGNSSTSQSLRRSNSQSHSRSTTQMGNSSTTQSGSGPTSQHGWWPTNFWGRDYHTPSPTRQPKTTKKKNHK